MKGPERIIISLYIRNNLECIKEWMTEMKLFTPDSMKINHYKKGNFYVYKEKVFLEEMDKEIQNTDSFGLSLDREYVNLLECKARAPLYVNSILLKAVLEYDIFLEYEKKIYELIHRIMDQAGIVGRIVSLTDSFWQNEKEIDCYERHGRSLDGIPIIPHPWLKGRMAVDIKKMPGYEVNDCYGWAGAAWKMWFHESYYEFADKEAIEAFRDCDSNVKISDTCRCITLYPDVMDYDNPENRARQIKFKKAINFEKVAEKIKDLRHYIPSDPKLVMLDGEFEHGGTKLVKSYFDENGKHVQRSKAAYVKIGEFDDKGKLIWKTKEEL